MDTVMVLLMRHACCPLRPRGDDVSGAFHQLRNAHIWLVPAAR